MMAAKKPAKKAMPAKTSKKADDTVPVYEFRLIQGKGKKANMRATLDSADRASWIVRERVSRSAAQELARKQGKTGRVTGVYLPDDYTGAKFNIRTASKSAPKTKKGTISGKAKKK